ncbi:WxcM-like domain-containing protein [Sphingobacterium sp. UT-1RO-CII-1]|uniref:WxcM-like domain-containing protein n=1 Tax=Sphingobacterium sp. UT-1RO-CII-1 TaxID=2995225 RepID=UPI00227BB1D8|nr:WxcM-like domain-containing protein [Sphingobacterium sp. UT-1RO-CII-1]MCY4780756.1 WxcM-like domain-containing protein [Sphingobacterium sp. UT-1RO-CII-1]
MISFIKGGAAADHRGEIRFVNDFDMTNVKRFYIITNADTELVRGWRAHRIEERWFYVLSGAFVVDIVKIDDWEKASRDLPVEQEIMRASEQRVLHVPIGHGLAWRALEPNSELLVFANSKIEDAKLDDYTYSVDYFVNRK